MSLKTNVGVSRKIADQNYGSRGASVNLEIKLDSALINDPERFHDRIRQVFRRAQAAIDDELNLQQGNGTPVTTNGAGNGHTNSNGPTNRNRQATTASEKQVSYARQLAKSISGLGIRNLETLAQRMYSKPLAGLSTLDASGLIDTLKAIKDGRVDLNSVLEVTCYEAIEMSPESTAALRKGKKVLALHCHQESGGQYIDVGIVERE
jgi:hypothetical protein